MLLCDLIPWCDVCGRRIWTPALLADYHWAGVRVHARCYWAMRNGTPARVRV